jgi:predicted DNA-binding transcriptional regulator AlpA
VNFIRIAKVLGMMGVSKSTLYREIRDNRFPAPKKIRGCSCWAHTDVLKYIETREQAA